jgi:hypothetical protein
MNTSESEEDSQVTRTRSISPYLLDDSSIHQSFSSAYVDAVSEKDSVAVFTDSYSPSTLFSNVSPNLRLSESLSPLSPQHLQSYKSVSSKETLEDRRTRGFLNVEMLVLLAHLEHVSSYAYLVRDILQLYSIDVNCRMTGEDGSSILPEHVAFLASKVSPTTRIMLIGPRHVLDGTCHFQTWDGRCMEANIFHAIGTLLQEEDSGVIFPKRNPSTNPYCSSVNVFVNKMLQRLNNTRHSLHTQVLECTSVCQSCWRIFQQQLEQSPSRFKLVDTLLHALHTTLPRGGFRVAARFRATCSSSRWMRRKTLYLLSIMRHWDSHVCRVREQCTQLYLRLSQMHNLHSELEKEMRLYLLNDMVDKCNLLDKVYQEMKQTWEAIVIKWLSL